MFQCTLIVEIRTRVAWLKSNLLVKIECRETKNYMKVKHSIILGQKEKALGVKRKVFALNKSLIYTRVKLHLDGHAIKEQSK